VLVDLLVFTAVYTVLVFSVGVTRLWFCIDIVSIHCL